MKTPQANAPATRRNGKLQSCEPCRKRKLACDHAAPHCGRCLRRGITQQCFYHPAPLTKVTASDKGKQVEQTHPTRSPPTQNDSSPPAGLTQSRPRSLPPTPDTLSRSPVFRSSISSQPPSLRTPGFLGQSASAAVVEELNGSLGVDDEEITAENLSDRISEADIKRGVDILAELQNLRLIERYVERYFELGCGSGYLLYRPIARIWSASLAQTLKDATPDDLYSISAMIWRNTLKPFSRSTTLSAQDWALTACGKNLRWEPIGVMSALVGIIFGFLPVLDPIFHADPRGPWSRQDMIRRMLGSADSCIEFCRKCGDMNDLFALQMYQKCPLLERAMGDVSTEAWMHFGQVCDTVIALGLHQEKQVDHKTPFFLCEFRIRLFSQIYVHDKFLATFFGRPPRISYRHCAWQEPLDLDDDQVCADDDELAVHLASLKDGWNTSGLPNRATWRKSYVRRQKITEDILEISLGPSSHDLEERVERMRSLNAHSLDSLPLCARIDPEKLLSDVWLERDLRIPGRDVNWRSFDVACVTLIHSGKLYADFLLERAVVSRLRSDPNRLIVAAQKLLRLTLRINSHRDVFFSNYYTDVADMLIFYATPPAGVLGIELLKREQIQAHDHNYRPEAHISRSETLQQMSVLVGALEAVGPEDGNHRICGTGLRAIRRVLDRMLDRRPLHHCSSHPPQLQNHHTQQYQQHPPPPKDQPHGREHPLVENGSDHRSSHPPVQSPSHVPQPLVSTPVAADPSSEAAYYNNNPFFGSSSLMPLNSDADFLQWLGSVDFDAADAWVASDGMRELYPH